MHDLVIFDCDGVLVDSEFISNQALADSLARYGLHMTATECISIFMGLTTEDCAKKAQEMGVSLPIGWVDQVEAETDDRLRAGVPVIAGVPKLLACLDAIGLPYCVASNGTPAKMKITLGQNGLWDRFEPAMFSAYALGVAKPDPALFQAAAQHFGATNPVVIEDSLSGVTAAMRANMRCLAYAPHGGGEKLTDLGAELFTDMAELPRLLGI
ncbi:HAD family phosphatase [Rhodobacteraceae bacterium B1Z28]|uniref:HAD family phosphatase n=1 Tax=Ruegeria haliotis TaxID=2747601 RepID=A0ABX2PRX4_9RHOB|nr:HAD family phosphatase [Ruegeria haliotis]NVO56151.1 HAD family phosphatase [Ruegeria haliotis]